MNHCFLMVQVLPAWLRLPRSERNRLFESEVLSLLPKHPGVSLRHFDCEAYTAICSDVLMLAVPDARALHFFVEALKDSALITEPYFELRQIIPAWEDGFRAYEAGLGKKQNFAGHQAGQEPKVMP